MATRSRYISVKQALITGSALEQIGQQEEGMRPWPTRLPSRRAPRLLKPDSTHVTLIRWNTITLDAFPPALRSTRTILSVHPSNTQARGKCWEYTWKKDTHGPHLGVGCAFSGHSTHTNTSQHSETCLRCLTNDSAKEHLFSRRFSIFFRGSWCP